MNYTYYLIIVEKIDFTDDAKSGVIFEVNDESVVEFEADTEVCEDSVFNDEGEVMIYRLFWGLSKYFREKTPFTATLNSKPRIISFQIKGLLIY